MSNSGTNNFFTNTQNLYSSSLSLEVAELQRRIILPVLPREIISSSVLEAYNELGKDYVFAHDVYKDMVGNFYVPMLFPLVENGKSTEMEFDAPKTNNVKNIDSNYVTEGYVERNFINLVIPKYIVMQFRKEIPLGTKFLVAFIGGTALISNIKIIGVIQIGEYKMSQEDLISYAGMDKETVLPLVEQNILEAEEEYETALAEEEAEYGSEEE